MGAQWERACAQAQRFTGLLIERHVRVLPGTDVPWTLQLPGHLLWRELALLMAAGMTPLAALRAATSQAAQILHADELGRLASGCRADLVIVDGDPTQAIPARPLIAGVVQAGRAYAQAELLSTVERYAGSMAEEPMGRAFTRYFGGVTSDYIARARE